MQAFARVLKELRPRLDHMRWWEAAIAALYLSFAVQEVGRGNGAAALAAAGISALFVLTPFRVFRWLPLLGQIGLVLLGVVLMVMFLNLGR